MEANTSVYETRFDNEFSISEDVGSVNHSKLQARITTALNVAYSDEYEALTEISLDLPMGTSEPDVAVFPIGEDDWMNDSVKTTELPILAIEILSPKQLLTDVTDKIFKTYLKAGIRSVWLIIPTTETIHVIHPLQKIKTFSQGRAAGTGSSPKTPHEPPSPKERLCWCRFPNRHLLLKGSLTRESHLC